MRKRSKYQTGGDSDFFSQLIDLYNQRTQPDQSYEQSDYNYEDLADQQDQSNTDYEDLLNKYNELEGKIEALGTQTPDSIPRDYGDSFMNLIFGEDNNLPIDWSYDERMRKEEALPTSEPATKGLNPNLVNANKEIFSNYNVTDLGAWGDKRHQSHISDHNTGDAQDYGISDTKTAESLISKLQSNPEQSHVKYIIYNGRIWNPSISNEWRPYKGDDPHTTHVHVSYNRQYGGSKYQLGGIPIANTDEELNKGLNEPDYQKMILNLPNEYNMIRGLDSGQPVRIMDQLGNKKVLNGPLDTKQMYGPVYEQKLPIKIAPLLFARGNLLDIEGLKASYKSKNIGIEAALGKKRFGITGSINF